jgi:hypothetical protein
MGNRGCLHDEQQRIRRSFVGRRWITCVLDFQGRHRSVMAPRRYTELFFLDEATALAAGHRPCAECQRERYCMFREIWMEANAGQVASPSRCADDIDLVLHAERLNPQRGKRTYLAPVSELPSGAMVADNDGVPFLVLQGRLLRWDPCGYAVSMSKPATGLFQVLTPRSIVHAILWGYPVRLHPSAAAPAR